MTNTWPTPPPSAPPPPAPPPFTPPSGGANSPSRGQIVGGAIVGAAMVAVIAIVAALVYRGEDAPDDASPVTTIEPGPGTSDAPSASDAPPVTGPGALDEVLDETIAFVEAERGHTFVTRPVVDALEDSAFVARYSALIDESYAEDPTAYDAVTVIYEAFGIIEPGVEFIDVYRSFGAAGVLGFYDTESNELVVRSGAVTPFARTVLVHELTHALDDQLFELYRPEYDDADDEVSFGLTAVVEGNARRVERAYYDTMSEDERRAADEEEFGYGANFQADDFTLAFLLLQISPYDYGEEFVANLLDSGGEAAVDAAIMDPPRTSEQVIDFDKFEALEPRVDVAPPPADGEIVEQGVVGQVTIEALLRPVIRNDASSAADGWAGDWFVAWAEGERSCARATFVMDSEGHLEDLADGFEAWADEQEDASVDLDDDSLSVTTCAG